jgi:hypothetical protein
MVQVHAADKNIVASNYVCVAFACCYDPVCAQKDLTSCQVELHNVKSSMLFTMVTLKPAQVTGCRILTPYLPNLSTICGSKFIKVPSNTLPTAEKATCIFHSNAMICPYANGKALLVAPSSHPPAKVLVIPQIMCVRN